MIEIRDVEKKYEMGGETVHALDKVSLSIEDGEFVAIIGPSGSGKSTLMNIIGCLDIADSGTYILNGKPIEKYSERQLARIRNKNIGFIFQGFNLLSKLSAIENVELPMIYQGVSAHERHKRATEALEHVGLSGRIKHKPTELSGGQQQRCAIARALAAHPSLILADEPTGNLDKKTGKEILSLFLELHEQGNTIVLITHDPKVADWADRIIHIEDGKITSESHGTRRFGKDELSIDDKREGAQPKESEGAQAKESKQAQIQESAEANTEAKEGTPDGIYPIV